MKTRKINLTETNSGEIWTPTCALRILKSITNGNERLQQSYINTKGERKWFFVDVVIK